MGTWTARSALVRDGMQITEPEDTSMTKAPTPKRTLDSTMTEIDGSGKETTRPMAWGVLPPPADHCQICGHKHEPELPHNAQSIYYQMIFANVAGRAVTWADALAHCNDAMRALWRDALGKNWTEPPAGVATIKHHGQDELAKSPERDEIGPGDAKPAAHDSQKA